MARLTGRGYALLSLAAGIYLVGRVVGTWELYLLAFAFLALVVVSWLWASALGRRLQVTRTLIPERPVAGDRPEFLFSVRNKGVLPTQDFTLCSVLAGLTPTQLATEIEGLGPREDKALSLGIGPVQRGVHTLPAVQAVAHDPTGIARSVRAVSDPLPVTIPPRIAHLQSCLLYPELGSRHNWSGRGDVRAIGPWEFKGIRAHQPGEPLSHIDWKSTAKTGVLMLREMDQPAGADITVILDGSADQVAGKTPATNYELAVSVAGSIADFGLRTGTGVSLVSHERDLRQVPLPAGAAGRQSLLQALAEAQPTAATPLASAIQHLHRNSSQLRSRRLAIVSLSLDSLLAQVLIHLREEGVSIALAHIISASFAGSADDAASPADDAASPLLPFPAPQAADPDTGSAARPGKDSGYSGPYAWDSIRTPEARALLLALSAAGITCLTLARDDNLEQCLSLPSFAPHAESHHKVEHEPTTAHP